MTNSADPQTVIRKVFICREGECIASENAVEVFDAMQALIHSGGHDGYDIPIRIKCVLTGCLDICKNGPIMVVHPGAVTYQKVDLTAVTRIFTQHLLGGEVVEDLLYNPNAEQESEPGN